ncbi:sperm-associated antigen 1-like [Antedon mediterranea]|uniref:sperm-associated antigen 1-like n=1 Tax=Antedon mediterranea TaxID=105859 RepID=UPI003AF901DA
MDASGAFGTNSGSKCEILVEHMDYSYIEKCMDTKELEKIIKKLKSGEEGCYPQLLTFCKERLAKLKPKSKVLIEDSLPATKYNTSKGEWEDIQKEMIDFEKIERVNSAVVNDGMSSDLPPIRNSTVISADGEKAKNEDWGKPSKDHIASSNYRAWDKYDAEAAVDKVQEENEAGPSKLTDSIVNIDPMVDTSGMSEEEKILKAQREKDKGNEAFYAKDFQEALAYYSRSLSLKPSLPAYNNRSLVCIKLQKFGDAIEDCNKVLESEPDNVKALLRRATAKKGLKSYHAAKLDIQQTLALEPGNKQAKNMLADIVTNESKNKTRESKGKRIEIKEVEGSDSDDPEDAIVNESEKKMENDQPDGNVFSAKKRVRNGEKSDKHNIIENELISPVSNHSEMERNPLLSENMVHTPEESKPTSHSSQAATFKTPSSQAATFKTPSSQAATSQTPLSQASSSQAETSQSPTSLPSVPPPLPSSTVSYKDEAFKLYSSGQYGKASEFYTKSIKSLLPDNGVHTYSLATLYSNRAACSHHVGDLRQCIQDCDSALQRAPLLIKAYLRRAKAYETLERYGDAYVDFRNVFHIDQTNKTALDGSARCMTVLKEKDGSTWREKLPKRTQAPSLIPPVLTTVAKSSSPAVTTSRPESSGSVKMSTGMAYSGSQQENATKVEKREAVKGGENVEKVTNKAKEKDEENRRVELDAQVENNANMAAEEILKSITEHERKIKADNNTASIQKQHQTAKDKGNMHYKKGEYDQAIKCYSDCVALDNTQTVGYTNRALCHLKINQPLLADQDCSIALKLDPNNVKAFYRRALSKKMLKDYKMSLKDLNTLLKIDATNKPAVKELGIVKELYRNELRCKQMESSKIQSTPTPPAAAVAAGKNETSSKKKKNNRKKIQIKEVDGSEDEEESKIADAKKTDTTKEVPDSNIQEQPVADNAEEKVEEKKTNGPMKSEGKKKKKKKSGKAANNPAPEDLKPVELKAGTPFEFTQSWASIHTRPDSIQCLADLLMLVQPSKLPQIVSHSLDGELLTALVECLNSVIIKKDVDMTLKVLQSLPKVQRFTTVMMFLSPSDKTALQQVFHSLSMADSNKFSKRDVEQLKKKHYTAI